MLKVFKNLIIREFIRLCYHSVVCNAMQYNVRVFRDCSYCNDTKICILLKYVYYRSLTSPLREQSFFRPASLSQSLM